MKTFQLGGVGKGNPKETLMERNGIFFIERKKQKRKCTRLILKGGNYLKAEKRSQKNRVRGTIEVKI